MTYTFKHQSILRKGFDRCYLTSTDFYPGEWLTKSSAQTAMKLFIQEGLIKPDEKVGGRFTVDKEKLTQRFGWKDVR